MVRRGLPVVLVSMALWAANGPVPGGATAFADPGGGGLPFFQEDFSGDLSAWNLHHAWTPYTIEIVGSDGNPPAALLLDDQLNFGCYATSKQAFHYVGTGIDFAADIKVGNAAFADQRFASVWIAKSSTNREAIAELVITGSSHPTPNKAMCRFNYGTDPGEPWESSALLPIPSGNGDGWHHAVLRVRPDGLLECHLDGQWLYTGANPLTPAYDGVAAVMVGGRRSLYDNVSVANVDMPPTPMGYVYRVPGGNVNGTPIDATHYEITVSPGEPLAGTIMVEATNLWGGNAVAPLGGTVDWGDREAQPWLTNGWIPTGTHAFTVDLPAGLTAPVQQGDYHIIVAFQAQFTIGQVMSMTSWTTPGNPIWHDGNDAGFDWTPVQHADALLNGGVASELRWPDGFHSEWLPATEVIVHVRGEDGLIFRAPGGNLNGTPIDGDHFEITVSPGAPIDGTIVAEATNRWAPNAITPLGGTVTWGDRTTQFWLTHPWIPGGTHLYNVAVHKTAPLTPGDYHIVVAFRAELNIQQVMSLTNWTHPGTPIWFDGNDAGFDWMPFQFQQALDRGAVATNVLSSDGRHNEWLPATAVVVHVESEAGPCPSPGSCTEPHPSPGCSDANCCEWMCSLDPFCCGQDPQHLGTWDATCAASASQLCAPDCDGNGVPDDQQPDCDGDGTPDVCELHPRFFDDFSTANAQAWTHHGTNAVNIGGTIPGAVYAHGAVDSSPPARITHVMPSGTGDFEAQMDIRRLAYNGSGSLWIGWVNVDDHAAVGSSYGWETHDSLGNPASGFFVQLNSGSGAGGAPHRSHLAVSTGGTVTAYEAFDPGPMGDNVWHTLKFGRMGMQGYVELRNRTTNALVAGALVPFDDVRNYGYFHISSIDGQSNNWWIDVEIDNLTLAASGAADCNDNGVPDSCEFVPSHGWVLNPSNGHHYRLTSASGSWAAAEDEAVADGGHLVAINDAAEQAWLVSTWPLATNPNLWIGLHLVGGAWVWTTGEPLAYTNWLPGEPSGDGSVAEMNHFEGFDGQWNDEHTSNEFGIIERAFPLPADCNGNGVPDECEGFVCDDGNPCTDDTCAGTVCVFTPNANPCEDGSACTVGDICIDGACAAGAPRDCDDGVDCTRDVCDAASGECISTPDDSLCDDARYCTGTERCDRFLGCQAGTPPSCDDGVECTIDLCDTATDTCRSTPDDSRCDDGLFCTGVEACDAMSGCRSGSPPDCDDGVDCTVDSCDEAADACVHDLRDADSDGVCDEGDECPHSDRTPTIVIGGCNTGVGNLLLGDGCTMSDEIAGCAAGASNHGAFVSCVALLTNEWKRVGRITGAEKGRIQSCAARADIPPRG